MTPRTLPVLLTAFALAMPAPAASGPLVAAVPPLRMVAASGAAAVPVAVAPVPPVLAPLAPWLPTFRTEAAATGVPDSLLEAVALVESGGNPDAVSPAGATGLMQLRRATAHSVGVFGRIAPVASIAGGARYLAWLGGLYGVTAGCWQEGTAAGGACGGRIARVLSAYAAGPLGGPQPWYVARVERTWREVGGAVCCAREAGWPGQDWWRVVETEAQRALTWPAAVGGRGVGGV